jgi:hypothetical protein
MGAVFMVVSGSGVLAMTMTMCVIVTVMVTVIVAVIVTMIVVVVIPVPGTLRRRLPAAGLHPQRLMADVVRAVNRVGGVWRSRGHGQL